MPIAVRLARGQGNVLFTVFLFFCKVCDVEERIAFQAYIDKGRLHAGKDAGNFAFVNRAGKGVFVLALVVDFRKLVIFDDCQPGFMRGAGNINFFCHTASFRPAAIQSAGQRVRQAPARYPVAFATKASGSSDCSGDAANLKLALSQRDANLPQARDGNGSEESWLRRGRTVRKDFVATASPVWGGAVSSPNAFLKAFIRSNPAWPQLETCQTKGN